MSPKQVIKTTNAPDPVGPYNQAIKAGDFIYCSGQIAIDPSLNEITCLGDIEKETIQVLKKSCSSSRSWWSQNRGCNKNNYLLN